MQKAEEEEGNECSPPLQDLACLLFLQGLQEFILLLSKPEVFSGLFFAAEFAAAGEKQFGVNDILGGGGRLNVVAHESSPLG